MFDFPSRLCSCRALQCDETNTPALLLPFSPFISFFLPLLSWHCSAQCSVKVTQTEETSGDERGHRKSLDLGHNVESHIAGLLRKRQGSEFSYWRLSECGCSDTVQLDHPPPTHLYFEWRRSFSLLRSCRGISVNLFRPWVIVMRVCVTSESCMNVKQLLHYTLNTHMHILEWSSSWTCSALTRSHGDQLHLMTERKLEPPPLETARVQLQLKYDRICGVTSDLWRSLVYLQLKFLHSFNHSDVWSLCVSVDHRGRRWRIKII